MADFDYSGYDLSQPGINQQMMYDRLQAPDMVFNGQQIDPQTAAGAVGSAMGESGKGLNPNAFHAHDGSDGSDSIGMFQQNGTRATLLKNTAANMGLTWNDPRAQIEGMATELKSTHKNVLQQMVANPGSVQSGNNIWTTSYEIPDDIPGNIAKRLPFGQAFAQQMASGGASQNNAWNNHAGATGQNVFAGSDGNAVPAMGLTSNFSLNGPGGLLASAQAPNQVMTGGSFDPSAKQFTMPGRLNPIPKGGLFSQPLGIVGGGAGGTRVPVSSPGGLLMAGGAAPAAAGAAPAQPGAGGNGLLGQNPQQNAALQSIQRLYQQAGAAPDAHRPQGSGTTLADVMHMMAASKVGGLLSKIG